jgi:molybdopterin/thiamine biosynthesis adenylyltransferase
MADAWTVTFDEGSYSQLSAHLFPGDGDGDEHGAVIAAGRVETGRGTRLLVRDIFLAEDGVDFIPGRRGYRMLTAEFVSEKIRYCRDQGLTYLAVHNHSGRNHVGFSGPDYASHERGYPALLDISGQPVGALVFAEDAAAGDIWTDDRERREVDETVVVGRNIERLYPSPPPSPPTAGPEYDRQVRIFGDRGQDLFRKLKVAVVGAGGVGLPLVTMLARGGVGNLVVIDPDKIEPVNLPRLPDARRLDAMTWLQGSGLSRLGAALSTRKVALAKRIARRANPDINFLGVAADVIEPEAAQTLVDCDFVFLAADSQLARMVFNAVIHQYLVPGVQIGTRIDIDRASGDVGDIRSNVRPVLPRTGCLRCNDLLLPAKIQEESLGREERDRNRYVDEVPAPSVMTFNTLAAAQAATDFMLMFGGLIAEGAPTDYLRFRPRDRALEAVRGHAGKGACRDCGDVNASRRGRGQSVELPLPERTRRRPTWRRPSRSRI